MAPKLSICIPTFNRANLLVSALTGLALQVKELGAKVELLVSDNNSTDDTTEVVERLSKECPIRYHRNEVNIGVVRNVLTVVSLAAGEFCWVLGDDDLVRDGAVRQILRAVEENPELDYFYVNYSVDPFERREGRYVSADHFQEWTMTGSDCLDERYVPWQALPGEDFSALTPIYSSVFRRSVWLEGAASLPLRTSYTENDYFSTLPETFPHAVIFARTMMGKRAWASGYPWVAVCSRETWEKFIPVVVLLRFFELFDEYEARGVEAHILERHRKRMLSYAEDLLTRIFQGEQFPRLESFSPLRFIAKHYRYSELWRAVYTASLTASLSQIAKLSLPMAAFAFFAKLFFRLARCWKQLRSRLDLTVKGGTNRPASPVSGERKD